METKSPETKSLLAHLKEALRVQPLVRTRQARRLGFRQRLSPGLSYGRHFGPAFPSSKPAAVMLRVERRVLSNDESEQWCIPLTVRDRRLPDHPGQISLPGGRVEVGETHLQAAEREFCEELCVDAFNGQLLGTLSPIYVYNSDYHVQAFVSTGRAMNYSPEQNEVERILYMPLDTLRNMDIEIRSYDRQGVSWSAPGFVVGKDFVWGATAIILAEFAAVLTEVSDQHDT